MDHARTIVIVGGGFAGTTLVRALDGKLPEDYELVLISEERVAAHRSLTARGVDVRTGTRATCVGARAVALAGGGILHAATTICTIGTRPNALVERTTIPVERGRIVVDPDLSVRDVPGL